MTTYSSFGMVKLSRTNFGFLTLVGLAALIGLTTVFTGAFLTAVLVVGLVTGFAACFAVATFFTTGFFVARGFATGFLATDVLIVRVLVTAWTSDFCSVVLIDNFLED